MNDVKMELKHEFLTELTEFVVSYINTKQDYQAQYLPAVIMTSLVNIVTSYGQVSKYSKDEVIEAINISWKATEGT